MASLDKTITLGIPLPHRQDYEFDVSAQTRHCINIMAQTMGKMGYEIHETIRRGLNVADHHNMLANDMRGDWLLIVGSDHGFMPDALLKLLDAANSPPYPRIIAALMPYRNPPYNYVATKFAQHGRNPRPIVPWRDFHPVMAASDGIMECDTVGSGFTLYHRSVFDTVPYPWFLYAPYLSQPDLEEVLQGVIGSNGTISDEIKNKARRVLAQSRTPTPYGADYYCCIKAADYGIKSYVHFGCRVSHFDYVPIMHDNYLRALDDEATWWSEALRAKSPTEQAIQEIRAITEQRARHSKMEWEDVEKEYTEERDGPEGEGTVSGDAGAATAVVAGKQE